MAERFVKTSQPLLPNRSPAMSLAALTQPTCEYQITGANWRDLNAIRSLEQACFPQDAWPLWDIIGVLTLPNVIRLKAVCGEQLIGFVAGDIRRSQQISWIATIGVMPEYRGQGVGRTLLRACEEKLPTQFIRLCVRASNQTAIRLYRREGYSVVGTWHQYYQGDEDALVMEKIR